MCAHVAGLHQVGDRADRVFDRHRRIEPRRAVDVDVIDAEPRQAVREEVLHRGGARVEAEPAAVGAAQGAELHREQGLVAPAAQRAADEQLVVAHAVEVAGVEQRDAAIERGVDRRDALGLVGRAVHAGHAHAAERERENLGPAVPSCVARREIQSTCAEPMPNRRR